MIKLKKLSVSLFISFSLSACATTQVPDFRVFVTLPASKDGFGVHTVSKEEVLIPADKWDHVRKRGLTILPEDWAILKKTLRRNCRNDSRCIKVIGALDYLFITLDLSLRSTK